MIILLSHGQAVVEQGFSTNKLTLADNLSQRTLVAKRVIKDFLSSVDGRVTDAHVTPQLLSAAAAGRQRYQEYLDKERAETAAQQRKRKACDDLDELRARKKRVEASIAALQQSADQYAV